jgi:hypothetical protein
MWHMTGMGGVLWCALVCSAVNLLVPWNSGSLFATLQLLCSSELAGCLLIWVVTHERHKCS